MPITVIERTSAETDKEAEELFLKAKPYLDKGYGFYKSVQLAKGLNHNTGFGNRGWYKRFKAYAESQGYKQLR